MTAALRPLVLADVAAVAAIEAVANPHPWSRQLFQGELALPATSRHWLVAEVADEIVGFGGMMYAASTAHLMNLAVVPTFGRRGIAQQLCVALIVEARVRGAADMTLEVRASNGPAIALYHKLGMSSVGNRPGYYPDGEDAVIFWIRDLGATEIEARLQDLRIS